MPVLSLLVVSLLLAVPKGQANVPPPPPSDSPEDCGAAYKPGQTFTTSCGKDCAVPFVDSDHLSEVSQLECLVACNPAEGCHCALYWASKQQCSLKWTPCNSAVLDLVPSDNGAVALQPCIEYPINLKTDFPIGDCDSDSLMREYPGWMISPSACESAGCKSTSTKADSIADCISQCSEKGYKDCKSVQYTGAEAFCRSDGVCTMYNVELELLGPHAASQVLQVSGSQPAAVAASYCSPPSDFAEYPSNSRPDFGVDWDEVCAGEESMVTVPDMQMGCDTCAFIPENREDDETDYDADFVHFESDSLQSCIEDCEDNDDCGCAFWRPSDHDSAGYCALTTAECSDPIVGAQIDYTRIRTAIVKCGYMASDDVREEWPDETYDGIDWFGIWDDVCQQPGSFTYTNMTTYCGPSCILPGTATIKAKDSAECSEHCKSTSGCLCSYFSTASGSCSLMADGAGACVNHPTDPQALAYAKAPAAMNDVTVLCGDFDFLDPAYYYNYD